MEKLVRAYIEKRIQTTRTKTSDNIAERFSINKPKKSQAELAREAALAGWTNQTASHLCRDETLSLVQKGEILAKAYLKSAFASGSQSKYSNLPILKEINRQEAQQLKKIARGLRRAARRVQNS